MQLDAQLATIKPAIEEKSALSQISWSYLGFFLLDPFFLLDSSSIYDLTHKGQS